jgi:antitoxin CptB
MSHSQDTDEKDLAIRRKRLRFRAWHRGMREADLLLGSFADERLASMDAEQLDAFEAVLRLPDGDLVSWMTGRVAVPGELHNEMIQSLLDYRYKPKFS